MTNLVNNHVHNSIACGTYSDIPIGNEMSESVIVFSIVAHTWGPYENRTTIRIVFSITFHLELHNSIFSLLFKNLC